MKNPFIKRFLMFVGGFVAIVAIALLLFAFVGNA